MVCNCEYDRNLLIIPKKGACPMHTYTIKNISRNKEGRGQEAYEWSQWMNRAGTITITPREMRDLFWKEENIVPISKYPPISSDAFYEILPAELAYIHVQQKPVLRILVRADANE